MSNYFDKVKSIDGFQRSVHACGTFDTKMEPAEPRVQFTVTSKTETDVYRKLQQLNGEGKFANDKKTWEKIQLAYGAADFGFFDTLLNLMLEEDHEWNNSDEKDHIISGRAIPQMIAGALFDAALSVVTLDGIVTTYELTTPPAAGVRPITKQAYSWVRARKITLKGESRLNDQVKLLEMPFHVTSSSQVARVGDADSPWQGAKGISYVHAETTVRLHPVLDPIVVDRASLRQK